MQGMVCFIAPAQYIFSGPKLNEKRTSEKIPITRLTGGNEFGLWQTNSNLKQSILFEKSKIRFDWTPKNWTEPQKIEIW